MAACAAHNLLVCALLRQAREQIGFHILWACSGWRMHLFGACALALGRLGHMVCVLGAGMPSDCAWWPMGARRAISFCRGLLGTCRFSERGSWPAGARGTIYFFTECLSGAEGCSKRVSWSLGAWRAQSTFAGGALRHMPVLGACVVACGCAACKLLHRGLPGCVVALARDQSVCIWPAIAR